MTSEVAICNLALSWLGGNLITALTDEQKEAKICNANYELARDAVLEDRDWTFATKRYILTPDVTTPVYGYDQQFLIPAEVLRVIHVGNNRNVNNPDQITINWQKEENRIVANETQIQVRAIARITDTARFPPTFTHALAARLAADIAIPLTASRSLMESMWGLYEQKMSAAAGSDGRQGRREKIQATQLVAARRQGYPI